MGHAIYSGPQQTSTKGVVFEKKTNNGSLLPLTFNNTKVVTCSSQKHLGLEQQLTVTIIFKVK